MPQPTEQRAMTVLGVGELLAERLATDDDADIEGVLGHVDAECWNRHERLVCNCATATPRADQPCTQDQHRRCVPGYRTVCVRSSGGGAGIYATGSPPRG